MLKLTEESPTILHCHNLHGGYFDLRALPALSTTIPTILTLHDAWLLSGHCAHSFECGRWEIGCGNCPDLTIYPSVRRDSTAFNWRRKARIFKESRLHVATPSQWLMDRVGRSMLAPVLEGRVIPNGVDLTVFQPADQRSVRAGLDIPPDARVLVFAAHGLQGNRWKDFATLRAALGILSERTDRRILFYGIGAEAPTEHMGHIELRFVSHHDQPSAIAAYYQAADVYVHSAKVDTFPTSVLEALACGNPVVGTAVGGIPEQVEDGRTGYLTSPGDPWSMADAILRLLNDDQTREAMAVAAAADARARFDLKRQASAYLEWYRELGGNWTAKGPSEDR